LSHFAEIDENNIVLRVIVGDNDDPNGDEGYSWITNTLGGRWIQTSYNANFRGKYAGVGDYYDEELDGFVPTRPFPSWSFNPEVWEWQPPVPRPEPDFLHGWDEESLSWVKGLTAPKTTFEA
jgi:hypothetical protein